MILPDKAAELITACMCHRKAAINKLQAQGHKLEDIVLIEFHGYPHIYSREGGHLRAEDSFDVRLARPGDKLLGAQTQKGFWIKQGERGR